MVSEKLIKGCVGGQLVASLLAVSCVTVAFCSNLLMVQDKVTGARNDLMMAPLRPSTLAMSSRLGHSLETNLVCRLDEPAPISTGLRPVRSLTSSFPKLRLKNILTAASFFDTTIW